MSVMFDDTCVQSQYESNHVPPHDTTNNTTKLLRTLVHNKAAFT